MYLDSSRYIHFSGKLIRNGGSNKLCTNDFSYLGKSWEGVFILLSLAVGLSLGISCDRPCSNPAHRIKAKGIIYYYSAKGAATSPTSTCTPRSFRSILVFSLAVRVALMRCVYCFRSSNLLLLACTPPKMLAPFPCRVSSFVHWTFTCLLWRF